MSDLALFLVFPALMIAAAFSDLFTMTIPNRIAIGLSGAFFVFAFALGLPLETVGMHLLAGLAMLIVTFVMFARGWMGGGDAKLAAATALWMGWENLADYLLLSTILGGALTLAILYLRGYPLPGLFRAQAWLVRLHDSKTGIPYGIALAVAGLALFPMTRIWIAGA